MGRKAVDHLWDMSKIRLLDCTFLDFLEKYKNNCIGLTARRTGKPSILSDYKVEDKIGYDLKELGVTFQPTITKEKELMLTVESNSMIESMVGKFHMESGPMYKHGIIFTCNINKGHVLDEYIKKTGHQPDMIYAFDDKKKNLEDIMEHCEKIDVPFIGFHNQHYANSSLSDPIPADILDILSGDCDLTDDEIDILMDYYKNSTK
jgi:hypothetical protein